MMLHLFKFNKFPFYRQLDRSDCGPTCLQMICKYFGKTISIRKLRDLAEVQYQGSSIASIVYASSALHLKHLSAELPMEGLLQSAAFPCILHWDNEHYVILWKVEKNKIFIGDPANNRNRWFPQEELGKHWQNNKGNGVAIFFEPTTSFFQMEEDKDDAFPMRTLVKNLHGHFRTMFVIALLLLVSSLLTLCIPLLTQAIVDKGIKMQSYSTLMLICLGQFTLYTGKTIGDLLRSRLQFTLGMKVSLDVFKQFMGKLMKLPLIYFGSRTAGDNIQRLSDNQRVEDFLTNHLLNAVIAIVTVAIYAGLLFSYDWRILFIFLLGTGIGMVWNWSFEARRKRIDQRKFALLSSNQQLQMEIFSSMPEIRLTGSEDDRAKKWHKLQATLFEVKADHLKLNQYVQGISMFINESKNILATFLIASLVIQGDLTLGAMLAITYMYGALNGPLLQLADFIRLSQDARFSLQRINEIQKEQDEDNEFLIKPDGKLLAQADIVLDDLTFRYGRSHPVLRNISIRFPAGKVTAIVGTSGSGKTTLIKLLLKFFADYSGAISIGGENLLNINAKFWRKHCAVVMQESLLFSDTIANNIWLGADQQSEDRLIEATKMVNMHDFICSLPRGYQTPVGREGIGLSEGQKQRLLIARMFYKRPAFIFLDEATNSLDANNERDILENMKTFFQGRTVIIVAHRLSTVRHADQLIVLESGEIKEAGTHEELISHRGAYYQLVKNQLELGT